MKVRSPQELSQFLDERLTWRKRELTTILFSIESSRKSARYALVRAGVCILYAHWEGFVKDGASAYLDLVLRQKEPLRTLKDNFIALYFRDQILECGRTKSSTQHTSLVRDLRSDFSSQKFLSWNDVVDTRSNLNSDVLRDMFSLMGIVYTSYYASKEKLIDERLVRLRNRVAHGERVEDAMNELNYRELQSIIVEMLGNYKTDIENAAITKQYRRKHHSV